MLTIFTSRSCGPCQLYKEQVKDIDAVTIVDIDDENNLEMAINYGIMMVPTSILASGMRWTGVKTRDEVLHLMAQETA